MIQRRVMRIAGIACAVVALSACAEKTITYAPPAVEDLRAVTEAKPKPPISILSDPVASERYNAEIEAWGERLRASGMRLCSFFEEQGLVVDCFK